MRNLNKWVKENGGTIEEQKHGNVRYEVKGIELTVVKVGNIYIVSVSGENGTLRYKTQKDIIERIEIRISRLEKQEVIIKTVEEAKPEIKLFEEIGAEAKHIDTKVVDGQEIKKWAVLDDPMDRRIFTNNGKLIATFHTWPQFEEWYYGLKKLAYSGGW